MVERLRYLAGAFLLLAGAGIVLTSVDPALSLDPRRLCLGLAVAESDAIWFARLSR